MNQFVSEYRKLITWRTWWFLAAAMVVALAAVSALFALAANISTAEVLDTSSADGVSLLYSLPAAIGPVFPLVIGVITVTREHGHRTLSLAYLAEPRRGRVFGAKIAVSSLASVALGVAALAAAVGVVAGMLTAQGEATQLTSAPVRQTLVGTVAVLLIWALIGVGLGALVRNQVVAIVGAIAFTQFLEPILRLAIGASPVPGLADYLPGAAGDALAGGTITGSAIGATSSGQMQGGLVLAGYAAVLLVLGFLRMRKADVL